jgi:hypothetical protein
MFTKLVVALACPRYLANKRFQSPCADDRIVFLLTRPWEPMRAPKPSRRRTANKPSRRLIATLRLWIAIVSD